MSKSLNLYIGGGLATAALLTVAANFADRNISEMPSQPAVMTAGMSNPDTLFIAAANAAPEHVGVFGLGRVALPEEVSAWDLDISPDGTGLPSGQGSVLDGEELFSSYCAVCHGEFAEGVGNWPKLSGGEDTLADDDPLKTVGSYWPYLSTTFDYVRRSMPFGNAQSLTDDEVYAIVAYILYSNYLVDEDFVLNSDNFLDVDMPNSDGFIVDDRAEAEYPIWSLEPCMSDCKESVEITMRAAVLDVTPEETRARQIQNMIDATNPNSVSSSSSSSSSRTGQTTVVTTVVSTSSNAEETAPVDAELAGTGEKVFKKCKSCHQVGDGAKNRTGPHLNALVGRSLGSVEGFKYSKTLTDMGTSGTVWNDETLAAFLANPKAYAKGTKMSFAGLRKESDVTAVIEYLRSFSR